MPRGSYIPQDLATDILLRLSDVSAIARFRSVNKQCLALLSDPKFLQRIIWFHPQNNEKEKKESTNVLILCNKTYLRSSRIWLSYSLLSYNKRNEKLTPIEPSTQLKKPTYLKYQKVPMIPEARPPREYDSNRFEIEGCCDGIFCINDTASKVPEDIILWNPSTSETKVVPASPQVPAQPIFWQQIGFGYDSKTRDYKVVRRRILNHYDRRTLIVADIYSLRNDSWREHSCISIDKHIDYSRSCSLPTQNVARSRNSGLGRVYWHSDRRISSFDMVEEVFDDVSHKRFPKKLKRSMSYGTKGPTEDMHVQTTSNEFMMSAVFGNPRGVYEIWGLLDFRIRRSWTKLFVVSKFLVSDVRMGLGPQGTGGGCYMFLKIDDGKLLGFDPETEEVKEDILRIRVVPRKWLNGYRDSEYNPMAYSYVPSEVSISSMTEQT